MLVNLANLIATPGQTVNHPLYVQQVQPMWNKKLEPMSGTQIDVNQLILLNIFIIL